MNFVSSTSGSKSSIFLDYSSHLRDAILNPLIKDKNEGIAKSLQVLEEYHLLRDDLDSLTELSLWPGQRNPNVLIDAKVCGFFYKSERYFKRPIWKF